MSRIDGRDRDALRPVEILPGVNRFAEGSCLIRCGNTQVLCTASVEEKTPPHVPAGEGWVTAEYSMLPRANRERSRRDITKLKLSPRSAEIQRLIGRSLRAAVNFQLLGERTITIDCDVLQGDGGTRTASVTGGYVALVLACRKLMAEGKLAEMPVQTQVAAVSAGIVGEEALLDLCYEEDSSAMVDFNCVMTGEGALVEVQGTGEGRPFTQAEQQELLDLCRKGIAQLQKCQRQTLGAKPMQAVLASKNPKKLKEMQEILAQTGVEVILQSQLGLDLEVEETGTTFAENAALKARAVCAASGMPAISDDSGLVVEALGGAPGVYSARYGGSGLDDAKRWQLLLKNMEGEENRDCKFVSVICCAFPNGDQITARGECPGILARQPRGDGGFGYDPVFWLPEQEKTMAELTPQEKHQISHRGNALRAFQKKLEIYLNGTDQ